MDHYHETGKTSLETRRSTAAKTTSPVFGRVEELQRLREALDLAAVGQGSVVFLTGQPGIGKTRLAREALATAKALGFTAVEGQAHPLEARLSYVPFLEALGSLLRSFDPFHLEVLVSGLPDLGRLFGDLRLPLPEPMGDPGLEKARLFEAIARLFERITQSAPIALFLDDLHRADASTIELFFYLARNVVDQRALLVANYGIDALDANPELRTLVESLQRDELAEDIVISRLTRDAVEAMVKAKLGGEAPDDLLTHLETRAGGTPLFVEAILAALIDSAILVRNPCPSPAEKIGWVFDAEAANVLPPRVRSLILERLRRLQPTDRRTIEMIAVMADAARHSMLRTATGLEEEVLIESLQHLMAAGLVAEGTEGVDSLYRVTHPLIQEVAYAELSGAARRRAHIAAIGALETFHSKNDVSRLARHYRAAGIEADPGRSLEVLVAAGERAQALYANDEAAQHYAAALAILRGSQGTEIVTHHSLPWLLERLGDMWAKTGKHGAALEAWKEAASLLSESGTSVNNVAVARLQNRLAEGEVNQGHWDMAKAHLAAGLSVLQGGTGSALSQELADLYVTRCHMLIQLGDLGGLAESTAELLSIAERLPSSLVKAKANLLAALASLEQNDVTDARQRAEYALTVAAQNDDPALCYHAHRILQIVAMRLGEHRLIRYHAQCGLALAQRLGTPSYEVHPRLRLACADFLSGAWSESLLNTLEAVRIARRMGNPHELTYSLAGRAMLLALRGETAEAEASIAEVRTTLGDEVPVGRSVFGLVDIAEAAIALERGEMRRALAIAKDFLRPSPLAAAPAHLTPLSMPIGLTLLAEVQVASGRPEDALETVHRITDLGPRGVPYLTALASRAEGLARQALGRPRSATTCLVRAYEMFTSLEMPFEAARSLLERAVIVGAEQPEHATRMARQSLAVFEQLGARRYADTARQLLRGFGISPSAVLPWKDQPQLRESLLSRRELEVARLVAEGFTAAAIARRLVLSRHTVNHHLNRIYRRLRIDSRAALTRYMVQTGLLYPAHEDSE